MSIDSEAVFELSKRVREEAVALDNLPGAALTSFLGGAIVIGVVGGGLWWVPAAMSGGAMAFKLVLIAANYGFYKATRAAKISAVHREELEKITRSKIPEKKKRELSNNIFPHDEFLAVQAPEKNRENVIEHDPTS